jgi:hypothetical protein
VKDAYATCETNTDTGERSGWVRVGRDAVRLDTQPLTRRLRVRTRADGEARREAEK